MQQTIILCPLYHDESSFNLFAADIEKLAGKYNGRLAFVVVNDGMPEVSLQTRLPLTVIDLHRNIGHQKAIAIGLAYTQSKMDFDHIVIADCDGEDRPEDILRLLDAARETDKIIVAKRVSRQEGRSFRLFYLIYKFMFLVLTGKRISFGNFMLLPRKEADRIVHYSEIWNHLAGTIIKSRIPFSSINTHRGRRYEGSSKMNFSALLLHGLGAIGVFIEIIASRLLIFSLVMIGFSLLAILVITYIRLFTSQAIPGWATAGVSSMLIVLLQSFLLSLFTIFLYLSFQGQRKFIPAHHYMDYVRRIENFKHG
ncbi:MAG TPA: glycosyltransferase [Flavisolibacter sp.]|nr:glycosyltransferase [Flavisolibacter sp.]